MGVPWSEQKPSRSALEVVRMVREEVQSGTFNRAAWDHNHPDRKPGRSNKEIYIAGVSLLWSKGYNASEITMDQAWSAVLEMVTGTREVQV